MWPDGAAMARDMHLETKASIMPDRADSYHVSLVLPERTVVQLDELVRHGHFSNREEALVAAVERLYADADTANRTSVDEESSAMAELTLDVPDALMQRLQPLQDRLPAL